MQSRANVCLCCGSSLEKGSFDVHFCSKDCLYLYDYLLSLLSLTDDRTECLLRNYSLSYFITQHPYGEILKALIQLRYDTLQHTLSYCDDISDYNRLKIKVSKKVHKLMNYFKQEFHSKFTYEELYPQIPERTCPYCTDIIPNSTDYFCSSDCESKYQNLLKLYSVQVIPLNKYSRPVSAKFFRLCSNPACSKPYISPTFTGSFCSCKCREFYATVKKSGYALPDHPTQPFAIPKHLMELGKTGFNVVNPFKCGSRLQARCVYCGNILTAQQKSVFKKYCSAECQEKVFSRTIY